MNRRKPAVGEKLYVAKRTTHPRNNTEGYRTVTKVGRVYFEIDVGSSTRPCKFLVDTWEQSAGGAHTRHILYETEEEYKKECEERELRTWWNNLRTHYNDLTTDKIRRIREIMEAPTDA